MKNGATMRVAIHSVDGHHFPNLALMRISAWHKARLDAVEWFMPLSQYDRVYASKVFTFTPDDPYLPPDAIRGGTGYDITSRLPPEIDATPPDYTIYPQFTEAYGFLSIQPSAELRRLARWCNRAWIRKQCKFEEYR